MVRRKKNSYIKRLGKDIRRNPTLYLMSLPALLLILLFCYVPMAGILMAFQEYSFSEGIFGSEWIGFLNFELFFNSFYFKDVLLNTFLISLYALVVGFGMPIIFALLVHSLGKGVFGKTMKILSIILNKINNISA